MGILIVCSDIDANLFLEFPVRRSPLVGVTSYQLYYAYFVHLSFSVWRPSLTAGILTVCIDIDANFVYLSFQFGGPHLLQAF